ncbi:cytochrome P450 family protein [Streptomyces sp. bgisy095]|uniref:cytochrome P450 family protein n=1 Tax=unclassified Streptomyces TaxID=2593676 RepID=UPI003D7071A1
MTAPPLQQIFDDAYYRDPYPTYARLRAGGGVHPVALPDGSSAWLVTTEAEVRTSLTNPLLSVNKDHAGPGFKGFSLPPALDANLLNIDASDHLRLRRLVSMEFTPRRVENLDIGVRQACEALAERLIDSGASNGVVDLVADLAAPLPLTVIGDLLGVPEQDRGPFASWVSAMLEPKGPEDVAAAIAHIHGYLLGLVALRRRNPDGNLISGLISVRDEQDRLSEDELLSLAFLILMAGIDNTQHVISSGVLALLQHPDQLEAIRADPELLPEAVEEILRYATPNHTAIRRFPTADVEIGDTVVPAGDTVLLCLVSAHRDPLRYPDPDRFDITRQDKAHLALGQGLHYCLGAPLARLQIRVALDVITTTFPMLALDRSAERLPWRRSFRSHALKRLPVTLGTCS